MGQLRQRIDQVPAGVERLLGFGPHHSMLPASLRQEAVLASLERAGIEEWLDRLEVAHPDEEQHAVLSELGPS